MDALSLAFLVVATVTKGWGRMPIALSSPMSMLTTSACSLLYSNVTDEAMPALSSSFLMVYSGLAPLPER